MVPITAPFETSGVMTKALGVPGGGGIGVGGGVGGGAG
jgi:hypothetical protein